MPAGEVIAVVGATGSGKTTLVTLLTRLYDPTEGRITLDGHDLRDLTVTSLRRHVGFAFEEPSLFSASVRENLLMGKPDATEAEVLAALEVAQAGFALDLPWGLDTRIGEQGLSLSGGQRQRLALARAIIGRPRILVLDDPLSAVDVHTEAAAQAALRPILAGCTVFIVVHRPSTVALADRSILLDEGRLVAVGTHHDLLDTEPRYRAVLSEEAEEVGARMTTVEPDEVHDDIDPDAALDLTGDELVDEWRGVNVEDVEEVTGGLAGLLRSRSRALLGDLIRPHHRAARRLVGPDRDQRGGPTSPCPGSSSAASTTASRRCSTGGSGAIRPLVTVGRGAARHRRDQRRRRSTPSCSSSGGSARTSCSTSASASSSTSSGSAPRSTSATRRAASSPGRPPTSRPSPTCSATASSTSSPRPCSIGGIGIALLLMDLQLALVSLGSFPILFVMTRAFRSRAELAYRATREAVALVIVHFVESLGGIHAVHAFRREPRNQEIFEHLDDRYRRANNWSGRLAGIYGPGVQLVGPAHHRRSCCSSAPLRVLDGDMTVGVLAAFLLYLRQFFAPMEELSQFYNLFQAAAAATEKLSGVLAEAPSVPEPVEPTPARPRPRRDPLRGRGVRLPRAHRPPPPRPHDPGRPDPRGRRRHRRRQDDHRPAGGPLLGPDRRRRAPRRHRPARPHRGRPAPRRHHRHPGELPVRRLGRRQHPARPARRRHARRSRPPPGPSAPTTSSRRLPDGYDTDVHQKGARLSAGQRQLVSFARAFLADPAVLILDEATSSLDVPSERLVQHALRTLLEDRTAVIIAHRLTTVEIADRVIVVDAGRIVEDGPPGVAHRRRRPLRRPPPPVAREPGLGSRRAGDRRAS